MRTMFNADTNHSSLIASNNKQIDLSQYVCGVWRRETNNQNNEKIFSDSLRSSARGKSPKNSVADWSEIRLERKKSYYLEMWMNKINFIDWLSLPSVEMCSSREWIIWQESKWRKIQKENERVERSQCQTFRVNISERK